MTEITPFQFPATGQQVRTVLIDGDPWFVLSDVAKILGYRDAEQASRLLRDSQLNTMPSGIATDLGQRGGRAPKVVTEGGLYRLVMRSNVAMAEPFQDWVTDEVLPAIRKTGSYSPAPALGDPLAELERQTQLTTRAISIARVERARADAAEERAAELEGPAHAWDVLASGEGDLSVSDAAKILSRDPAIKTGRDRLFEFMAHIGWVYRQRADGRWRAYQTQVDNDRLSELPQEYENKQTGEMTIGAPQVRVKIKGLRDLHRRLCGTAPLNLGEQMPVGGGQ